VAANLSFCLHVLKIHLLQAGIDGAQLSIALEPEAASVFCQLLPTDRIHGSEGAKFQVASPGTKYMVIDLGGTYR